MKTNNECRTTAITIMVCIAITTGLSMALVIQPKFELPLFISLVFTIGLTLLLTVKLIADMVSCEINRERKLTNTLKNN